MLLVALNNVIAFIAFAAVLPALYGEANAPLTRWQARPHQLLLWRAGATWAVCCIRRAKPSG